MKRKVLFALFNALASLPFSCLYLIADVVSFVIYHFVGYRKKVVRNNLVSSFPEKSLKEIKGIEKKFYRYLGDQIFETIKTLKISDKELKKRVTVSNYELVNESLEGGKNAVLLMGHYGNWEWAQEITRYFIPTAFMVSIYHPLSDKVFDDLFIKLRSHWHAHIVPMAKAPRILLNKQNMPWVCGFIADAWTWQKNDDNWIDFLNHKTWFITGPEEIGNKTGAEYFYLEMNHKSRGHYDIVFHKIEPEEIKETYPYTRQFWKEFEKTIQRAPSYWLWSHKRWK